MLFFSSTLLLFLQQFNCEIALPLGDVSDFLLQRVEEEALVKNSSACKDYLIEAMKYHLLPTEQRILMKSVRTRLRTPMNLPKVGLLFMLVITSCKRLVVKLLVLCSSEFP